MLEYHLVLKNARIIDVLYDEITPPMDIGIRHWSISAIGGPYKGWNEVDLKGKFLAPGFGDSHIHLESTILRPKYAVEEFLRHGTTYIVHDPHEAANVYGLYGITSMMNETEGLPCHVYVTVPSCVPPTSQEMGLETNGSHINVEETDELMYSNEYHERIQKGKMIDVAAEYSMQTLGVVGLGEVMNIPGVLNREEIVMKKIAIAKEHGGIVEGHGAGLKGDNLERYFSAGIGSDHEVISFDEWKARNDLNVWVYGRYGSASHDLDQIIPGIVKRGEKTDKLSFCTDDIKVHDLMYRGHIDHCIRKAIRLGMEPVEAFRVGSLNGLRRLGKKRTGAIEVYYSADLAVISTPDGTEKTLDRFKIDKTIYGQKLVVNNGELLIESPKKRWEPKNFNSVKLARRYEPEDFTIGLGSKYVGKEVQARVIEINDGTIVTKELIERMYTDENGILQPDPEKDILPTFVVGRHETSKGNIGRGFVKGVGIKNKIPYAISTSITHDCHNIIVTGTNPRDISIGVNRQKDIWGGIVLVENGSVTREVPLRYFGLMSTKRAEDVYKEQTNLNERLYELGAKIKNPAINLSFVPLIEIPEELRLTDKGLVKDYKIVDLVV